MNNGYIKLWRKIIDTSFFKKPNALQLAIYLLLEANHKPYQMIYDNQELTIERGQLITGLFKMQEHTGLSIQNIRTSLKILVNSEFLTKKSTNKLTIITLCNYNEYQSEPTSKLTSKLTNKQQTSNKQITTIQEVKELKEGKEEQHSDSPFSQIWAKYPNRKGRSVAERHFNVTVKTDIDISNINKALENYMKSDTYRKGYVQNGSTWFNNWKEWINPSDIMMNGKKPEPDKINF